MGFINIPNQLPVQIMVYMSSFCVNKCNSNVLHFEQLVFLPCNILSVCRYLEKNLPSPSTLPITVQLSVPQKGFVANDVIVKPSDTYVHVGHT